MVTATGVESLPRTAEPQAGRSSTGLAHDFHWRVVDDPPPPPEPTRFQRLYTWLYEFNRY